MVLVDKKKLSDIQYVEDTLLEFEDAGDITDVKIISYIKIHFKCTNNCVGYSKAILYQKIIDRLKKRFRYVRLDNNGDIWVDSIDTGSGYNKTHNIPQQITSYIEERILYNISEGRSFLFNRNTKTYNNDVCNFAFYDKKAKHMTIIIGIQHRFFNIKVWDEYYYILSIFSITDMWSLLAEYLRQLYKLDIKEVNLCAFTPTDYKIKFNSEPKVKYYL
mgnify:CR=1 FL=1